MNGMRPSDAELAQALRAHLPAAAEPRLRKAIFEDVDGTPQVRSIPGPIGALLDADPMARRRALLIAAALTLALSAGVVGVIGALIDSQKDPVPDLTLQGPADLVGFVRGAYAEMPKLPPMTITATEDGAAVRRIYVDASGAIRIERYATLDAAKPETYAIFVAGKIGELLSFDSGPAWYEENEISEDPRVFVFAELGAARYSSGKEYGCEVAISSGEVYSYTPGHAWRYIGLETVAGRDAHHVACASSDLWLDVETRLTLRSQGPKVGPGGFPVPGSIHTIEVTAVELGQPDAGLFVLRAPQGVPTLTADEYDREQCLKYGWCLDSPLPEITPPPAPGEVPVMAAGVLADLSRTAPLETGPYTITITNPSTFASDQGSRIVVMFDGSRRYRIETTTQVGTVWEDTSVTLIGDGYGWSSELRIDGTTIWRKRTRLPADGIHYPLRLPAECAGGWKNKSVDLIAGRIADHIACAGDPGNDFWIDRATHLVVRTVFVGDPENGATIQEVTEIRLGQPAGVEWDLPADAKLGR